MKMNATELNYNANSWVSPQSMLFACRFKASDFNKAPITEE